MNKIWNNKVSGNQNVSLEGTHRVTGQTVERTIGELLESAQNSDGVYGSDNKQVSGEMAVRDLTNWHADYSWQIA